MHTIRMTAVLMVIVLAGLLLTDAGSSQDPAVVWKHLSSKGGDLPAPNPGTEQTSATVFDIDKDGINDFVITERTSVPTVVAYRRA